MAAFSADTDPEPPVYWKADDGVHVLKWGTSAAAAHVAGALALLLEQDPGLTPSEARTILRESAYEDSYTGPTPNANWGYGKLHLQVEESSSSAAEESASGLVYLSPYPNPTSHGTTFFFDLPKEGLSHSPDEVILRIFDIQGREIALLKGSSQTRLQRLTWDGLSKSGKTSAPGVYFGRLDLGDAKKMWKFLRVE
jgi:hypothetical protein